jgi:hypothetical protein
MATVALLITASNGMTAGYPALLLPQLQSENSTLPTTEEEGSWIGANFLNVLKNSILLISRKRHIFRHYATLTIKTLTFKA